MARFIKSRKISNGTAPGSLIFIGNKKMEKSKIHLMLYNKDLFSEQWIDGVDEIPETVEENMIMWINVYGLQDTGLIAAFGEKFSIQPLELEDILNTDQRPKVTEDDNSINIFLKVLEYREETQKVHGDQISLVIGKNLLITFQERQANYFEPIRERIRNNKGRLRNSGSDYLAYAIIDTLVDGYIHTIEGLGSSIENMEEEVLTQTKREIIQKIYNLKTNVGFIRKNVWPLREMMLFLNKTDSKFITKKTLTYLKDLLDLTTQAMEAVEIYYNMTNDYLSIYHANVGNRTNDIMKVLTVFASIFIPLTFITGIYGTNFDVLPELHFRYGYFMMLGVMALIAVVMLYYFKRKNWL